MKSQRWKTLERDAAAALGGRRIRRRWDLFESAPDVRVDDFDIVAECKTRERFAYDAIIRETQRKYCHAGETAILCTRAKGGRAYATVPLEWLAQILHEARRARARQVGD
jgi:hypothetical protein